MIDRAVRKHRTWKWTIAALALSALAFAPALAQVAQTKTCSHEGRVYKAGEKLTIGGKPMVCDGASGTWVADKG